MIGVRRLAWFPPALLGFLVIGLLSWQLTRSTGWFAYTSLGDVRVAGLGQPFLDPASGFTDYSGPLVLRGWASPPVWGGYWQVAAVIAFLAAMLWYGVHAHRAGVAIPSRTLLQVTLGGLFAIVASALVEAAARSSDGRLIVGVVSASLGVIGLGAGGWAAFRPGPWRRLAATGSARLAATGSARLAAVSCLVLVVAMAYGFAACAQVNLVDAVTVVIGLALLTWLERSRPLAVTTAAFALAALAFPTGVPGMLVPAAVLLAGAIAVLVTANRPTAPLASA